MTGKAPYKSVANLTLESASHPLPAGLPRGCAFAAGAVDECDLNAFTANSCAPGRARTRDVERFRLDPKAEPFARSPTTDGTKVAGQHGDGFCSTSRAPRRLAARCQRQKAPIAC